MKQTGCWIWGFMMRSKRLSPISLENDKECFFLRHIQLISKNSPERYLTIPQWSKLMPNTATWSSIKWAWKQQSRGKKIHFWKYWSPTSRKQRSFFAILKQRQSPWRTSFATNTLQRWTCKVISIRGNATKHCWSLPMDLSASWLPLMLLQEAWMSKMSLW